MEGLLSSRSSYFVWFGKWNRKWVHPNKFHGMTPWKIIPFFSNQTCNIYFLFLFVVLFNIKGHVSRRIWLHFGNPFLSTLYRFFCSFAQKYGSTMWQQNIATWLDGYNLGPVWYSSCRLWHQLLAIVFNTVLHSSRCSVKPEYISMSKINWERCEAGEANFSSLTGFILPCVCEQWWIQIWQKQCQTGP